MTGIWQIFSGALKIGIFWLMGSFNSNLKEYELKIHRVVYLSWQWRITQNLKRNWHVISKLTWWIWRILIQALESLKNFPFNGLLSWNWRGIQNLERNHWLQNCHEEFDKFLPEQLKVPKIFTLMCSFWAKYKLFELKKNRGVICHET